jgi:hypothetical protein
MNAGESPGQRYRELQRAVQEAILRDYPNPARNGCPGSEVLRALAANRIDRPQDEVWEHVTHCSPCYGEYLGFVGEFDAVRRRRNRVLLAGGLAALFALGFWIRGLVLAPSPNPPVIVEQPAPVTEPDVVAAVLNLESQSATRSGSGDARQPGDEIQRLPRARLALSIYLPRGSEPGRYEVELLGADHSGERLLTMSGEATVVKGLTRLDVEPNFSQLSPGRYTLATRRAGLSWRYFSLALE